MEANRDKYQRVFEGAIFSTLSDSPARAVRFMEAVGTFGFQELICIAVGCC
jgi:hypothetical protein